MIRPPVVFEVNRVDDEKGIWAVVQKDSFEANGIFLFNDETRARYTAAACNEYMKLAWNAAQPNADRVAELVVAHVNNILEQSNA